MRIGKTCAPQPRGAAAFTLMELLVVITIVGLLASMLMPAVMIVRRAALTTSCANLQRQLAMGFLAYANDNDDLPSNKRVDWILPSGNSSGESGGFLDLNWNEGYVLADGVTPAESPAPALSPFGLAWDGEYVASRLRDCPARPPGQATGFFPWGLPWFRYNGPGARFQLMGNNGQRSGLFFAGGYATRGSTHGVSMVKMPPGGAAATGLFSCPGFQSADGRMCEPHGAERWTPMGDFGYGNGQDDWGWGAYQQTPYDRNVTFADGHSKHVAGPRSLLLDAQ